MVKPVPIPPSLKNSVYNNEPATFTDMTALFKYFLDNHVRRSLTSPPLLKDVKEGTFTYDSTLDRLYTCSNGALKYVQFS